MNLVMEIETKNGARFVNGQTKEKCKERADRLYGPNGWEFLALKTSKETYDRDWETISITRFILSP